MVETVYKIVIKDGDGFRTLFRTIRGTKRLTVDKWLEAENIISIDGSGGQEYLTGIHCFKDLELAYHYLHKFRTDENRIIITCLAKRLRQKPTNKDVWLADEIYIPSQK